MTDPASARDIHSLFSANAGEGDLVQARKVEDAIGLCLSGGGYRAMIYHVGALIRLNEQGLFPQLKEFASVSGGSITAGMLAVAWPRLQFDEGGTAVNFNAEVAEPLLRFSRVGVDLKAIAFGLLPGCSAADSVAASYDRHLFKGTGLQDISDAPRFTFMATNLQAGSGWRFAKAYAADFRVGRIDEPQIPLSPVVAASSAFPPFHRRCALNLRRGPYSRRQAPISTARRLPSAPCSQTGASMTISASSAYGNAAAPFS